RDARGHSAGDRSRGAGNRGGAPREIAREERARNALPRCGRHRRIGLGRESPWLAPRRPRIARGPSSGAPPRRRAPCGPERRTGSRIRPAMKLAVAPEVAKALAANAAVVAARSLGATTVAATVEIAAEAGIQVVTTGGIGSVHRGAERSFDESADLEAIARHPVVVVSAGAKFVLDLALTLERLETLGVPVLGYGTDEFPAFYVRSSGLRLAYRVNDALGAARIAREQLARGAGMLLCVPVPVESALERDEVEGQVRKAIAAAQRDGIRGADLTPYLLRALGDATHYRALDA